MSSEPQEIGVRGDCGPALLYVHHGVGLGGTSTFVDREAVTDPRERALCRAVLLHALALLDASEPAHTRTARPGT